ncbi:trihelix transcription factor GTL2 [Euphorbia lathyris]|uniref:trihelix transcription factor GTL2 n=1 Tax=Euphorbia lathyris TaxID=212925 RepID=UPI0033131F55
MFESDQFHQFIDSRTTPNSLPFLLSFPNSNFHPSSSAFSTFDNSFSSSSSPHVSLHPNFLPKIEHKEENNMLPLNLGDERDRSVDPWTTDELLTLFRIRSSMENWFPDFTWDHVSRKLAEFGFKKSAEMCKEKFEEESRYLNNMNTTPNFIKNYRVFGEFEDLYHSDNQNQNPQAEKDKKIDSSQEEQDKKKKIEKNEKLKRKRDKISSCSTSSSSSFEMFKGFCEDIISTIIGQQEQMHNKLLQDMAKRDQEKIAREEEWKKQELDRLDKELQLRAEEQVLAGDRQATIINFLNKFSSNSTSISSSSITSQNPNPKSDKDSIFIAPKGKPPNDQNPNPSSQNPSNKKREEKDDLGKRWPKDEVLALINLRCSFYNSSNEDEIKESVKGPLWERISKGMLELGYRRNAKRCKEKWENINKYFRKTKDNVNKKRSMDSRTCPYFHQLSTLYSQGKLLAASSDIGGTGTGTGTQSTSTLVPQAAEKNNLVHHQASSGFEFEF